ncbi:GIY-YIG nuclease family protein [Dietzia maris]|uniref:GIY-YIG nuclease family protein n=1 Tax=Dietzia maris TaxID=37915 RepID=UPI002330A582|nr:GIY-YIG nuclease family protein [Dietzia maris]
MSIGKSVRLFLAEGTPGGLLTAEIMNWTGHVTAAPRSDLAALLKRPEVSRTGVYLLLGDDPDGLSGQMAYIGEGDDVRKRLYDHGRPEAQGGKDFWDRAVVLTSKDANLTKAHVRYIESRLIELAAQAQRARLTNGTSPPRITLPEADVSDMEYFLDQAKIILPVLGVNLFRSIATPPSPVPSETGPRTESTVFEMTMKRLALTATAREVDGEFTVLEGSRARREWSGVENHSYVGLRAKLEQDGTLAPSPDDASMYFTRNYVFNSPSAAAAIVAGRAANGRTEWLVQGHRTTYGEWETQGIDEVMTSQDESDNS